MGVNAKLGAEALGARGAASGGPGPRGSVRSLFRLGEQFHL